MADILIPGDTILVKASHGMMFSEIVEKLTNYATK
jgi:UDP-N-acetylmuramyl pentapeptide synthase